MVRVWRKQDVDDQTTDALEVERQRMFFGGRELRDSFTLASCGLKKGNVVQVMGRPTEEQLKQFMERYA